MNSTNLQHKPQALLLLGCPEVAMQTSLALYTLDLLVTDGVNTLIAGNNAALELVRTADPKEYYVKDMMDLDTAIADLAEKRMDPDICYVFIHNDTGISYLATVNALISRQAMGIIFGPEAKTLAQQCTDLQLKNIWARAVHNPGPLRAKITKEIEHWAALKR
ncbi:MAG: DUF1890 family protein [Euryarchaeota archaeon]|nr:DUF1890 family protein [Euryarchaeota archaeon]